MDGDETLARVRAAIKAEPAPVIRPNEPSEALASGAREEQLQFGYHVYW